MLALFYGALAAFALWRVRGDARQASVAGALLAGLVTAAVVALFIPRPDLAAALALIEAVLVLALMLMVVQWREQCGGLWCACSLRAMAIGIICLGKIGVWTLYAAAIRDLHWWNWHAAAINAGFVLQAGVAGGWCDGLGRNIADLWHRLSGRRARHVARGGGA